MGPIKQSMIGGLLGNFWCICCWNASNTPSETFIKLRKKCLPSTLTTFNQSINHKLELHQEDFVLFPSTTVNMLRGITNSPTSNDPEEVSHHPKLTPQSHGPADDWIQTEQFPNLIGSGCVYVNTDKILVTLLHPKLLLMSWNENDRHTIIAWRPGEILPVTEEVEKPLCTRRNLVWIWYNGRCTCCMLYI